MSLVNKYKDHKNGLFLGVFIPASFFGLFHLVNLATSDQVLPVLIQVIFATFIGFFFGVLLVVANLFCIKVWKNIFNYCLEESEPHGSPLLLVPIVIVGLMSIPIFHTITNITWLKIWIAPKLYLLEYTADLVK